MVSWSYWFWLTFSAITDFNCFCSFLNVPISIFIYVSWNAWDFSSKTYWFFLANIYSKDRTSPSRGAALDSCLLKLWSSCVFVEFSSSIWLNVCKREVYLLSEFYFCLCKLITSSSFSASLSFKFLNSVLLLFIW